MAQKNIIPVEETYRRTLAKLEAKADKETRKPGGKPGAVNAEIERLKNKRAGQ